MHQLVRTAIAIGSAGVLLALFGSAPAYAVSPAVVVGHTDNIRSFSSTSPLTIAGPSLGAGTWWVTATAEVDGSQGAATSGESQCELVDGVSQAVIDSATWLLDFGNATGKADVTILLTGVATSPVPWHPDLVCVTEAISGGGADVTFVRIDAVSGSLARPGGPRFRVATSDGGTLPGDSHFHTVGSIALPAGRWTIVAKTDVQNPSLSEPVNVTCRLRPSTADNDQTTLSLSTGGTPGSLGELVTTVAHSFGSAAQVNFACRGDSVGGFTVDKVRLVAVKLGKLTRGPLNGSATTSGSGTPAAFSRFQRASISIPTGSMSTLASVALPAGKWFVVAKAALHGSTMKVQCRLANDEGGGFLGDSILRANDGAIGVYMVNPIDVTTPVHAAILCVSDADGASLTDIRITAIQATSVNVVFLN